jgi:(hydroxyamino)benzene mutase
MPTPPSPTSTPQHRTAHSLITSGLSMQLLGLTWGFLVKHTPFPRLGLTAHIQLMAEGAMVLLAGVTLTQTSIVRVGERGALVVKWGLGGVWVSMVAEMVNAWWGTKEVLPIVSCCVLVCFSSSLFSPWAVLHA